MRVELLDDGTRVVKLSPMQGMPFWSDWLKVLLMRGAANEVIQKHKACDGKGCAHCDHGVRKEIVPLDRNQEQLAILDDEGKVGIICIGCGKPIFGEVHNAVISGRKKLVGKGAATHMVRVSSKVRFDKIRIGGIIQRTVTEQVTDKEIKIRWRPMPVFKMGIGCKECQARYEQAIRDANGTNMFREVYSKLLIAAADKQNKMMINEAAPKFKDAMNRRCELHRMPFCAACIRLGRLPKIDAPPQVEVAPVMEATPYIDVFEKVDAMDTGITELSNNA